MNLKDKILAGESKVPRDLAAKVQSSFVLRAESKRLLDLVKHAVETAIAQGEEAAMRMVESSYISSQRRRRDG